MFVRLLFVLCSFVLRCCSALPSLFRRRRIQKQPKSPIPSLETTRSHQPKYQTTMKNEKPSSPLLRVYGRSELAQLYYGRPISDRGARLWFMRELSYVPGLMDKLRALGLTPKGKIFTPAQVAAIFEALGEPG
ncbi:MAG: DUF4248 domain-containing protein [Bacteroidales bacterium]|nr:DUF4248 domain-containing protein [Bacteroidales bacterium]